MTRDLLPPSAAVVTLDPGWVRYRDEEHEVEDAVWRAVQIAEGSQALRLHTALKRAGEILSTLGHPAAKDLRERADALLPELPREADAVEELLRSRPLTAAESRLLTVAWWW